MRILLMNYEWPPIGGGGAPACQGGAMALAGLGHTIDVVTMAYDDLPREAREHENVRVFRVPCWRRAATHCTTKEMVTYLLPAVLKARALHRQQPYDINYTHFVFPTGLAAWLLYRLTGLPYAITSHGSDIPGHNPKRFQWQHKLLSPVWRLVARNARGITAPSEPMLATLDRNRPGCPTCVVPNGMDPWPAPDPGMRRAGVVCVGRLLAAKRFELLIEAAARAGLDEPITLVGDGPHRAALEACARQHGVEVRFAGWVDRDSAQFRDYLLHAALFVFPSERESFGMVVLEAMMAGLPCLVAAGSAPAEVAGPAAETFTALDADDLARKMSTLLADVPRRNALARHARARAEEFTWPHIAGRLEAFLHDAAKMSE